MSESSDLRQVRALVRQVDVLLKTTIVCRVCGATVQWEGNRGVGAGNW